jgi:hypothetical protein
MRHNVDHHRPARRALLWAPLFVAATGLVGCAQDAPQDSETAQVGVQVAALSTCGGSSSDPLGEIKKLQLNVRENVDGTMVSTLKNKEVVDLASGSASATFGNIPAGSPREVTLLGVDAAGTAKWYGRRTGINIKKNVLMQLDMTMMALDGFTCVGAPSMANAVFSASTTIDGGRVLITGGFSNATASGPLTILEKPSDAAYIFDSNLGTFERLTVTMKAPRAGHSMIYLPKLNQVLIVGGASKMTVPTDGPPKWEAGDGVGLTYEVFDIASKTFLEGPNYGANCKKRVFPNLVALTDDYVVAMGGAPWPISSSDDYAKSDRFTSKHTAAEKTGHFEDAGNALQLNAVRAGAAVAYMAPTTNGTARYFIWGGATIDQHFCPTTASPGDCPTPSEILHGEVFVESTEPGTGAVYSDFVFAFLPVAHARQEGGSSQQDGNLYLLGRGRRALRPVCQPSRVARAQPRRRLFARCARAERDAEDQAAHHATPRRGPGVGHLHAPDQPERPRASADFRRFYVVQRPDDVHHAVL